MLSLLPTSLLALLLASPALTVPTSPNDPFHNIAVHMLKQPEEPVCCLRPLSPLDQSSDEDILLSFEDWKAKRLTEAKEQDNAPPTSGRADNLSDSTATANTSQTPPQTQGVPSVAVQDGTGFQDRFEPHFRIPITDRFNYASLDCSARVHAAHKSAKSASSILSSKKDRYMLSPCSDKNQYVIVELCEDIRIDTVQLANFEFFSGVFKDFSVSVSKTYTTKLDEWTPAGTFRAKNVRGVQSFHPPPTLRDFYRFLRVDFHSHYSSEYYCPVSLLRVYGLTHLDAWQWETWEAESRAKRFAEEASPPLEVIAEAPTPSHTPIIHSDDAEVISQTIVGSDDSPSSSIPVTSDILDSLQYNIYTSSNIIDIPTPEAATVHGQEFTPPVKSAYEDATHDPAQPHSDHVYSIPVLLSTSSHAHSTASDDHSTSIPIDWHPDSSSHSHPHASSSIRSSSATPNVSSLSTISPSHSPLPAPPVSTGGESIYRTIMNRLTALEANTTLYARYVEEQTAGMREVLRRLTEDIGRLEGIGKAQAQLYQRSVVELEKQTRRLEDEQRELLYRVNYLTDEVVLEKRLGIAQLCLLLTVLIFMALTRGSRGEYAHPPGARASGSMREWGRRTLSLSGELVNRLRTRSSTPPRAVGKNLGGNEVVFPSVGSQTSDDTTRSRRVHAAGTSRKSLARPHTPTSIRTPTNRHFVHHRTGIPTSPSYHAFGSRPAIQRSSSGSITLGFGGIGPVPKSARRWARTAHLHEVKVATPRRPGQPGGDDTPVPSTSEASARNVFDTDAIETNAQVLVLPAAMERSETITLGKGKERMVASSLRQPSPLRPAAVIDLSSPPLRERALAPSEGDMSEGDVWVDTDVDGSECDSVVDAGQEGMVRERTWVANNSL